MNITPLHDKLLVRRLEAEKVTSAGIVIPDNATEKPNQGTVLAIGPGKVGPNGAFVHTELKAGDTVLFGKHAGTSVKVDEEELYILKEEEVFARIHAPQ